MKKTIPFIFIISFFVFLFSLSFLFLSKNEKEDLRSSLRAMIGINFLEASQKETVLSMTEIEPLLLEKEKSDKKEEKKDKEEYFTYSFKTESEKPQKEEAKEKEEDIKKIEINSAKGEVLEKLSGIGPVYAERIIEERPFCSLSEITNVKGIGETTLKNIKKQGLAYVDPLKDCFKESKNEEEDEKQIEDGEKEKKYEDEKEESKEDDDKKEKEKIEINSASLDELQKITGIGEVYAERIIEERPFCSLSEITNVKGIGEARLEAIKEEGLVFIEPLEGCFDDYKESKEDDDEEKDDEKEKEEDEKRDRGQAGEEDDESENDKEVEEKKKIEINSACLDELQKITGIGPVYAERIIEKRPFCDISEITNVKGIGEARLKAIKEEDLAFIEPLEDCLDKPKDDDEKKESKEDDDKKEKEKIEINSASLDELQKITGIGEVYAERIIEERPFCDISEITNVRGIGEARLEAIKEEGLAFIKPLEGCFEDSKESKEEDDEKEEESEDEEDEGESKDEDDNKKEDKEKETKESKDEENEKSEKEE